MNIENLLNPRTLAWTGGALLVAGIAFLVSIGIRDGWITPTMQVGAATLICVALGVAGFWLKERRSQGAAAMSMVATGIAGMFATITVASQVYDFLDPLGLALLAAGAVGLIGTAVALRWNSEPLAGLALLGALASPILIWNHLSSHRLDCLRITVDIAGDPLALWQRTFPGSDGGSD